MRMNRGGMLAMMDAMVFMAVIMIALSASVYHGLQESDQRDPGDLLGSMLSAEVRMSDFREDGDGSKVKLSDLMALSLVSESEAVDVYVLELLETYSAGRHYRLTLTFGEHSKTFGEAHGMLSSASEMEVPVTTGGSLNAYLELFAS